MKKYIVLLLALFLVNCTYAFASCEDFNPPKADCPQCCYVDINIETRSGEIDYFVGDDFTFYINFTNVGTQRIDTPCAITIIFPNGNLVNETFNLSLEPLENDVYYYKWRKSLIDESFGFLPFISSGAYGILITANESILFATFYKGCQADQNYGSFRNFFDVMPRWQKEWKDYQSEYLNATIKINERLELLAWFMTVMTFVILVLTGLNVYLFMESRKN